MNKWTLAVALIALSLGVSIGNEFGRRYSTNPKIFTYRKQQIITEPGDAICPYEHMCKWQVVDGVTGKPIDEVR